VGKKVRECEKEWEKKVNLRGTFNDGSWREPSLYVCGLLLTTVLS